ncbi:MAG: efflux RND transporter periplasmic adaptor subunit [Ignavibacteriales bacterium]|nr:MAG: efflux RND transporter periplasmic adaptor subunit [Ignavibacteriales bacterium]
MKTNSGESTSTSSSFKDKLIKTRKSISSKMKGKAVPKFFKKKRNLFITAVLFLVIIVIIAGSFDTSVVSIPTFKVKRGNFLVSITESGELRAKNSVAIIAPRIRGSLKIVYIIPEGSTVKGGDTVLRFDPTEAMSTLRDAESKLELAISDKEKLNASHSSQEAQMESDLRSAELTYELSKLSLDQMKFEAEAKQQEAKLQHEKNRLSYERTKKDIESKKIILKSEKNRTEIEIKQRQSELDKAKSDLAMLTLTAPTAGLVVYETNWSNNGRKFAIGDNTWPGSTIITLPDLSSMESITSVNEVDVSKIAKNQKVEVKLDAFPDSSFDGFISNVASLGRTKSGNSTVKIFELIVGIKNMSPILKPGMTTSNKMIINKIPNVLSVPLEAVFEKNGKKIVYVKNGSGFDEHFVEVGEKGENSIIVKKGLENNEEVALQDPTIETEEEKSNTDKSVKIPKTEL